MVRKVEKDEENRWPWMYNTYVWEHLEDCIKAGATDEELMDTFGEMIRVIRSKEWNSVWDR